MRVLALFLATACGSASPRATPPPPVANERGLPAAREVAPNCFEHDRETVQKALATWDGLARSAKLRWIESGALTTVEGAQTWPAIAVSDLQPGSLFAQMGLRDGDIVYAMNGIALTVLQSVINGLSDPSMVKELDRTTSPASVLDIFGSSYIDVLSFAVLRDSQTIVLNQLATGGPRSGCDARPALQRELTDEDLEQEAARADERAQARAAADAEIQAVVAAITKVNETTFEIARNITAARLRAALEGSGVRMVQWIKDGQHHGVKVYAVRPTSPYAALGLKNGDAIYVIGGVHISTPEAALDALARVAEKKTATIELVRRGAPVTLTYSLK